MCNDILEVGDRHTEGGCQQGSRQLSTGRGGGRGGEGEGRGGVVEGRGGEERESGGEGEG